MKEYCEVLIGWNSSVQAPDGYVVQRLVGDASTRSYFRIFTPSNQTLILMKMPEPFDESRFPYLDNYFLLQKQGVRLAEIYHMEPSAGHVFLQDLGDLTFYELFQGWSERERLHYYIEALEAMRKIEIASPNSALAFDTEKLNWELNFFLDHFLLGLKKTLLSEEEKQSLQTEFLRLASELASRPRAFCHRDYHSRNLMVHRELTYIIDFQDARFGPATYDLASLCYDSYIQHSRQFLDHVERLFFAYHPDSDLQNYEYPRMCLQRNLKALGTFGYQASVLGREFYLQFVGPTLGYVRSHLARLPEYDALSKLLAQHLPELAN